MSSANEAYDSNSLLTTSIKIAKFGYIGTYVAFAAIQPYYGLFLSEKGFAPNEVGGIAAMMPITNLLILPIISYIADRHRCSVYIIIVGAILSSVSLLVAGLTLNKWIVTWSIILHFIGTVPLAPFMDQHTMAMLPESENNNIWGKVRAYGTYGWGIGAPFAASLVTYFGWSITGLIFIIGMLGTIYCIWFGKPYHDIPPTEMQYGEVIIFICKNKLLMLSWIALICMGMGYVFIGTYLFMFLSEIGASLFLLGLSVTMSIIIEIPLFRHARQIHAHLTDIQLMTLAMIAWVVRVLGYSFIYNPWGVLLLEPLHGFTFGAMWLAGVHIARQYFPPDLSTSSMGFLTIGMFGIGPILGNIIGGILYEKMGPRGMLRMTAFCMGVVCVLFRICACFISQTVESENVVVVVGERVESAGNELQELQLQEREREEEEEREELQQIQEKEREEIKGVDVTIEANDILQSVANGRENEKNDTSHSL